MITSRAKKISIVAAIYCLLAVVILVGAIYYTEQNKNKFADVRNKNSEAVAMKQLATKIEQTLLLSESDRNELDSFFISERDTIHFITRVEELANLFEVEVETTQLAVIPAKDGKLSRLHIGFISEGQYDNVEKMLSALETLPYHKSISQVSIKKAQGEIWEGSIDMYVTLQ